MVRKQSRKTSRKSRETLFRERRLLEKRTREILKLKESMATDAYELGRKLNEIQAQNLWEAGNYEDFEDYLARGAEYGTSRASAYRYMAVAERFKAKDVRKLGAEKLALVIAHVHAEGGKDVPEDVANMTIEVQSKDGKVTRKTVADASTRELERAVKRINERSHEIALDALPDGELARRILEAANAALDDAELEATKMVIIPGAKERKVAIHNINLANLWRALRVIAKAVRPFRPKKKSKQAL